MAYDSSEIIEIKNNDKCFPQILREIHDCPKQLYCRGNTELLNNNCFAVVGTRKLTSYGKEAAMMITRDLSHYFTIVSGLALGVDAVAHRATLDAKEKTIAVLGSGADDANIYPNTNFRLARDILANDGLIVSEYAPGTHATEFTFPRRNRIISGLSKGVLIIEADKESGSLITAKLAVDQNRDVFAVPGSIFSSKSLGPNKLIQGGAKLVMSAGDILEEYDKIPELFGKQKMAISTENPVEQKILAILNENGKLHIDEIIRKTEEETSVVVSTLSMMEIRGIIENIQNFFSPPK